MNLHGKLYEKSPDGGKDQSVFNIRVGTAIMFLVKNNTKTDKLASLYFTELYGTKKSKYKYLNENNCKTTKWEKLSIDPKYYFFEKKTFVDDDIYDSFYSINDIFIAKNSGVQTGRDHFILANNSEELKTRLQSFINSNESITLLRKTFELPDQTNFKLSKVKENFKKLEDELFCEYAYKPFYPKIIYYDKCFLRRNSSVIMNSFKHLDNVGLVVKKRHGDSIYTHCFVTKNITDLNFLSGQSYIFPLYDYFMENKKTNISNDFIQKLNKTYSQEQSSDDIFYYIYAILNSNQYRQQFSEKLKLGFPKIPITKSLDIFASMVKFGRILVTLHLLSSTIERPIVSKFHVEGNNDVHKCEYDAKQHNIYINGIQYFDNVSLKVWNYEVGKTKVIQHFIKRKEGSILSLDDTGVNP